MIQRIQTIYLLLASVSLAVILFLSVGYQEAASKTVASLSMTTNLTTFILALISAITAAAAIFLFRNRKLQMTVTRILILLALLTLSSLIVFDFVIGKEMITQPNYVPIILAFFGTVFSILAHRGIASDEKLVRSMDRLR